MWPPSSSRNGRQRVPQGEVADEPVAVDDPEVVQCTLSSGSTASRCRHGSSRCATTSAQPGLGRVQWVEVPQPRPVHRLVTELGDRLGPGLAEAHVGADELGHGPDPITWPAVRANELTDWNRF